MKSIVFFLCMVAGTLLHARMLDAVAVVVEGLPITTREIASIQKRLSLSKQKAIDLLIQDRLQKAAMKEIAVDERAVDEEIARIAKLNGLSVPKLQRFLKERGTSWNAYRQSVKTAIKQRIFFQQKVAQTIPQPTDAELRRYYADHQEEFNVPKAFRVIEYSAATQEALERYLRTRKGNVRSRTKTLQTEHMTEALLEMLSRTPKGEVTAPINTGTRYVAYKVLRTEGRRIMPFEAAKEQVASRWAAQQRERALKDYFKKMRTEADIRYLRK